ncbi:Hypp3097 [Branchiostoma lanceolatum]|uniref:Hypp3097 protein n=1 Tax=Branchiostoma lanceolatum TaxID=7740 RepID=A0A8J9ZZS2_BRALA|nr:Hypp3097 [Branchiostoma lanceolatum]
MAEAIRSGVVPGDTTDSFSGNSTRPAAAPTRTRNTVLVGAAAKHTRFQSTLGAHSAEVRLKCGLFTHRAAK